MLIPTAVALVDKEGTFAKRDGKMNAMGKKHFLGET